MAAVAILGLWGLFHDIVGRGIFPGRLTGEATQKTLTIIGKGVFSHRHVPDHHVGIGTFRCWVGVFADLKTELRFIGLKESQPFGVLPYMAGIAVVVWLRMADLALEVGGTGLGIGMDGVHAIFVEPVLRDMAGLALRRLPNVIAVGCFLSWIMDPLVVVAGSALHPSRRPVDIRLQAEVFRALGQHLLFDTAPMTGGTIENGVGSFDEVVAVDESRTAGHGAADMAITAPTGMAGSTVGINGWLQDVELFWIHPGCQYTVLQVDDASTGLVQSPVNFGRLRLVTFGAD